MQDFTANEQAEALSRIGAAATRFFRRPWDRSEQAVQLGGDFTGVECDADEADFIQLDRAPATPNVPLLRKVAREIGLLNCADSGSAMLFSRELTPAEMAYRQQRRERHLEAESMALRRRLREALNGKTPKELADWAFNESDQKEESRVLATAIADVLWIVKGLLS